MHRSSTPSALPHCSHPYFRLSGSSPCYSRSAGTLPRNFVVCRVRGAHYCNKEPETSLALPYCQCRWSVRETKRK
ncbi:unnamed protein product, partial [Mesorhabditis spiculigera]